MVANLKTVEVPGYAEAVRREQYLRTTAFLSSNEVLCGVEVRPLSLRTVVRLEIARNGFVVPCQFESDLEAVAHALQVIWFSRPGFDEMCGTRAATAALTAAARMQGFIWRMMWIYRKDRVRLAREVKQWVSDAFMDAPKSSGRSSVAAPSYAAYPAYVVDTLFSCGAHIGAEQVMDMPLKRLWQHWHVGVKRNNPHYALSNPSDDVFTRGLSKR